MVLHKTGRQFVTDAIEILRHKKIAMLKEKMKFQGMFASVNQQINRIDKRIASLLAEKQKLET